MPMIPFIGVRTSWLTFAKNCVFVRFAFSALSWAAVMNSNTSSVSAGSTGGLPVWKNSAISRTSPSYPPPPVESIVPASANTRTIGTLGGEVQQETVVERDVWVTTVDGTGPAVRIPFPGDDMGVAWLPNGRIASMAEGGISPADRSCSPSATPTPPPSLPEPNRTDESR